ncbi:prepilin-type N-terminal cleavage/methylation domain-containing protein [Sporofaciens musculi]|uniref:prepilin-type N-terminal cleavage/methylation domain-containing protein n=1 Tax=Sporofaciens musculi TaxID=2681861 RepID=UPI00258398AE|nr:prepilin-type N-terminal cleavage/methylation domain-containing protein [Sporofaciens musculi]
MRKYSRKGFTLTELVVVLVILAIIGGIAIPFAMKYMKLAEFRENEANAKTIYLAAESELTWYRTSGKWKDFRKEVVREGKRNDTFDDARKDKLKGRIYAITLGGKESREENAGSGELVLKLLEDNSYDKDFLNASITIELDIETGQVYSAFYATRCDGLSYDGNDDEILNITAAGDNRSYDNRRDRLLGYYSVEDVTNVVELKPVRLKVTAINLVNSETLSLNWSSNSRHDNLDVEFHITFYKKEGDKAKGERLFSTVIDRSELRGKGLGKDGNTMVHLKLEGQEDAGTGKNKDLGEWAFPLTYQETGQNGRFSLVLDGMMSAKLMESLKAETPDTQGVGDDGLALLREYSTSITRYAGLSKAGSEIPELAQLARPQDICAEIKVQPTYRNMDLDAREYHASSPVTSNVENTMFASVAKTEGGSLEAKVTRFRHLSNIRYCGEEAIFRLDSRNMDWTAAGTGLFDLEELNSVGGDVRSVQTIRWKQVNSQEDGKVLDFPSIGVLGKGQTLVGSKAGALLSNLKLGSESVAGDDVINKIYKDAGQEKPYAEYLGVFCEVEGSVSGLTLKDPVLSLDDTKEKGGKLLHLSGVGILCGRSEGSLTDITVQTGKKNQKTVEVLLGDRNESSEAVHDGDEKIADSKRKACGIGGIVGVLAKKEADGSWSALTGSGTGDSIPQISGLEMNGSVTGRLPKPEAVNDGTNVEDEAKLYFYGIGGIFGYGHLRGGVKAEACENHADIKGNLFTGGIGGHLDGSYQPSDSSGSAELKDSSSDGLVLCSSTTNQPQEMEGRYFGGILGYGNNCRIDTSYSASGRLASERYDISKRDEMLLGKYVGGIIGYGNSSQIVGCSTKKGGYILGSDFVGGIAGGFSNDLRYAIKGNESITMTTNASYIIGNNYVGGIVGKNEGEQDASSTMQNCVNQGVAAGYGRYIGGIVGYNGQYGVLEDCASYLSDYDQSVYRMVTKTWEANTGDCVGGMAGYNDGKIYFSDSGSVTVKSVASLVVGRHFVGGMIGFNDIHGNVGEDLSENYTLIGGRIHGFGNAVGGCIGLNASAGLLKNELEVKPTSVTGTYYVGGCIGANVVDMIDHTTEYIQPESDIQMDGFRTDNRLGSITGDAFVGGVIGYHRTYSQGQLGGMTIHDYLLATVCGIDGEDNLIPVLPEINEDGMGKNLPANVLESDNPYGLTVSMDGRTNNNVPIKSWLYTGGVTGYCEKNSRLVLKNCINAGNITKNSGSDSGLAEGVSLKAYLMYKGMDSAASELERDEQVSMAGGIISVNQENQIIDYCSNSGSMNGFVGLGGIVSFNSGGIFNCELSDNFGNAGLDYIGGIAGLNVGGAGGAVRTYTDVNGRIWRDYAFGTIANCSTRPGRTIAGNSYVGGIVGYNMLDGVVKDNYSRANVTAAGNYAGGIAGYNEGKIQAAEDDFTGSRSIIGTGGEGVGGIAGVNKKEVEVLSLAPWAADEVVAVNFGVSVTGRSKVGGIVGINAGSIRSVSLDGGNEGYLVCGAGRVHALNGYAGGIAGEAQGDIRRAINRSGEVTASRGPAGGIVAVNQAGVGLSDCENQGSVTSDQGYAGGIAAENYGTIAGCSVGYAGANPKTVALTSRGTEEIGAVCAVNHGSAMIQDSTLYDNVTLNGEAQTAGGIAGVNRGMIGGMTASGPGTATEDITSMPQIKLSSGNLTIGSVAGQNQEGGIISGIKAQGLKFEGFYNYKYLGGIAGENQQGAAVLNCIFSEGSMKETADSTAAGNCYGGIVGDNYGKLDNCKVEDFAFSITGIYTATSTSSAKEKEALSSHVGGIAGKNGNSGEITGCVIGGKSNEIRTGSGMAGGIAGYNGGSIEMSGDETAAGLMLSETGRVGNVQELADAAQASNISADSQYVEWNGGNNVSIETLKYNGTQNKVSSGRKLSLIMSTNGNVGGITAYNTGGVDYCATGDWYLNNKSNAIGVGTGGIIGMNESGQDLSFLLNQAFVGRELASGATDRFAGGIIGNQNNTTLSGWKLENCVNYGTIYCLRTHYSGGILGQWTGTGGTIENCQNYGNLQTTFQQGWLGAAGGIVAQLYHAYEENEYNIISCKNFGNIYGRTGKDSANCANDSAGILGNVTAYKTNNAQNGQSYRIQVLDCVNGPGVEVYSSSMASGVVGFFSCSDGPDYNPIVSSTGNISLRIERCRNYAAVLNGVQFVGGIFGERYGTTGSQNTILRDCYSVDIAGYNKANYPVISYVNTANRNNAGQIHAEENYYLNGRTGSNSYLFNNGKRNTIPDISNDLKRAATNVLHYITKDGRQYYAYLEAGKSVSVDKLKVLEDGSLLDEGNQWVGRILFEIDGTVDGVQYDGINKVVNAGSNFDTHVRNSFYIKETGGNLSQMPKPERVELKMNESKLHIQVTPAAGTDPFQYIGALYRVNEDGSETLVKDRIEFFSEEFDLDLTEQEIRKGSTLRMKLRAYSMDPRILPSEEVIGDVAFGRLLPEPQIRIELTKQENGPADYQYRFKLVNAEDYTQEENYRIAVKFMDQPVAVLTRPDSEGYLIPEGNGELVFTQELQQLLIQAVSGNTEVLDSNKVPIPAYMPRYRPSIALFEQNQKPRVTCTVSGESVTDLGIAVTLDTSASGNVTTPPVYRAELMGTWGEGNDEKEKNAVLASQDMLTAPNGKAVASFNLPEYIFMAKDLRVRVWYIQSGLGPVYTYRLAQEQDANIYTIQDVEKQNVDGVETFVPVWEYGNSPALDGNDNGYFAEYRWTSGKLFDWITPPPHLMEETELEPEYDEQQQLQYTFRWDQGDGEYQAGNRYVVSLTGINGESKVSILTEQEMTGNELTKVAEEWTYDYVELTVTRKGDASGTQQTIGLTSTKIYQVKQRLKQPEQPYVVNTNADELFYTAEWAPIKTDGVRDETGCVSYGIYLRCYEEQDGVLTPGEPVLLNPDEPVLADDSIDIYRKELNLEEYAGQRVLIYIVAQAAQDSTQYVNSVEGITYDLTIPQRIKEPEVTWEMGWEYDRTLPVSVEEFQAEDELREGKLTVKITPMPDSIPTGDSSYLFKGYVFDSPELAEASKPDIEAGKVTGVAGLLATYPVADGEKLMPVAMEADSNNTYSGTIRGLSAQHAGKWLLLYTRISSGNGQISSKWTASEIVRLPYVRLDQPEVSVANLEREITLEAGSNPDLLGTETWKSSRIALDWQNVEWADSYYITLQPRTMNPDTDGIEVSEEQTYRIVEEADETALDTGNRRVTVYRKTIVFDEQQGKDVEYWEPVNAEEDQPLVFALEDYWAKDENGVYTEAEIPYAYRVTLSTRLEVEWDGQNGFKYTLILPDAENLTTLNGTVLTDVGLNITERVLLSADVAVNTPDGVSQSEAYTNSGDLEVLF